LLLGALQPDLESDSPSGVWEQKNGSPEAAVSAIFF